MDTAKRCKLERYVRNATRFLWGLGPQNQKQTYRWLYNNGFLIDGKEPKGSYGLVIERLLSEWGVERVLEGLIVPPVRRTMRNEAMDFLRDRWETGERPDTSFLTKYGIDKGRITPFLEVNWQSNYVERWGEFAGIWFEEIEPIDNFSQ